VSAAHERRTVKIRRSGRHTTPSQVEKVAEKAGKAAPAMAIAGVLVAAPQAHAAVTGAGTSRPAATAPATIQTPTIQTPTTLQMKATLDATAARVEAARGKTTRRTYDVRSGDSLSSIAQRFYHDSGDWQWLYHENDTNVSDPNLIYPGEELYVPFDPPANYTLPSTSPYQPKHAATTTTTTTTSTTTPSTTTPSTTTTPTPTTGSVPSGTLGCSGLEQLWDDAGGSPSEAFIAAEIAMAESGGNQYAVSPTNDYGYWQINGVWGPLATFDPLGNARAAIQISDDGTDWEPWTTYQTGAYEGQC
jgi:LysM repeat protein